MKSAERKAVRVGNTLPLMVIESFVVGNVKFSMFNVSLKLGLVKLCDLVS